MNSVSQLTPPLPPTVARASEALLREHQRFIWARTDRLICWLMQFEWMLGIALAVWRSPLTWAGGVSHVHPHVWAAIFLGGAIALGPIVLAISRPGSSITRHLIAVAQMLMSGLLIDMGNGQIEMHFQIFGALAFLAFYRDWSVVVTASMVTALDHIGRGVWLPESIYGVSYASGWLTAEHLAWVVFEDVFLIGSCVRGVTEMRGIAENRALLENSYHNIEQIVGSRTAELRSTQDELIKSARTAGMAEIAISVLHNVGNVLNSVNVSATIVVEKIRHSEIPSLAKVSQLIASHGNDLAEFLTRNERGQMIPGFISDLADCLANEQVEVLREVESLSKGVEHIKQIVATQQSLAKGSTLSSAVRPSKLFENAIDLRMGSSNNQFTLVKQFAEVPEMMLDEHKVLQILINLISNATHALTDGSSETPPRERIIKLSVQLVATADGDRLQFAVGDNGVGIAPQAMGQIFKHGFTTKKDGHGFGLHSSANFAREMSGTLTVRSDGKGRGALFILDLPAQPATNFECRTAAKKQASCNR